MPATRKLLLPGGSGFLGHLLARWFGDRGWDVITLTRRSGASPPAGRSVMWDGRTLGDWTRELNGADAVVNLAGRSVESLRYIRASGGEPAGEERAIKSDDIRILAENARKGLERLIAEFDDPATPYRALRRPSYSYDYDAYAQLARVAEWSAHVDEEAAS